MSERDAYPAGVPCWVDNLAPDPDAAMAFYGEAARLGVRRPGPRRVLRGKLRGRTWPGSAPSRGVPTGWNTYVSVESAEQAAEAAAAAGGRVLIPPFDALPAGRVAVLADPTGAAICVWEPRARQGARLVNEASAWAMSVLHTGKPEVAEAFYKDVFGWESEPFGPPGMALFRLPGYVGGVPGQPVPLDVVAVMAPGDGESYWQVGFWVADADEAAAKATELGGSVVVPPSDAGGMRQAIVADTHGAQFSVVTAPPAH